MTDPLFPTNTAKRLFLAQLEDVVCSKDLDLHVCDRLTDADAAHLREQIQVLRQLVIELRCAWALDLDPDHPDERVRLDRVIPTPGSIGVPPTAGGIKLGTLLTSIAREAGELTEAEAARFGELREELHADVEANPPPSPEATLAERDAAVARSRFFQDVDSILDQNPDSPEPKRRSGFDKKTR